MRAVLVSVQPKWCELICTCIGWENQKPQYKKRLELRKTAPKPPFKAYIYETKGLYRGAGGCLFRGRGQVIGEFICNYVIKHCEMSNADIAERMACVSREDILKYANGKNIYGWHIDNLVIYKKPKELSEFYRRTDYDDSKKDKRPCSCCDYNAFDYSENCVYCSIDYDGEHCVHLRMKRPPQSWCYIEEKGGESDA